MTKEELLTTPWSPMCDRPNVNCPHRAPVLARQTIINEHNAVYEATIYTNRTKTRYWLEVQSQHWLRLYLTTTSKKKLADWMLASPAEPPAFTTAPPTPQ